MDLKSKLRSIKDFPKEGIEFIDITTLLQDGEAFSHTVNSMKDKISNFGEVDLIVAPESRGFIFGCPVAYALNVGFAPIRKKGKLPHKTIKMEYQLEYGTDCLEMHVDAVSKGQKVVIVDDLLATGGTTRANIDMVESLGGQVVGVLFLIELEFLEGRKKLEGYNISSILKY